MLNMNGSPFVKPPTGPAITPQTMHASGRGGQQNPPYLQARKPMPVVTPKPTGPGDTVRPLTPAQTPAPVAQTPTNSPPISPPQRGGQTLGDVYNFMKSDLQNQAKQAKSNAIADASARGVYYGTPLTGSEADIDTQYLRGLGQLDVGMYGNEQQNQLARLGMATNLSAMNAASAPPALGGIDWSGLGALFGSTNSPNPAAPAQPRQGPVVTPAKNGEGYGPPKKGPQID